MTRHWPSGVRWPRYLQIGGNVQDFWHWFWIGFGAGIGFTVGQWLLNGLLGLLGQGAQRKGP